MPANPSAKWNPPKSWRIRATAADGVVVTLGRYETAEQAEADRGKFAALGGYRHLVVQPIGPSPAAPAAGTTQ